MEKPQNKLYLAAWYKMWNSIFKIKFLIYEYFHVSSQWKNQFPSQTECSSSVRKTSQGGVTKLLVQWARIEMLQFQISKCYTSMKYLFQKMKCTVVVCLSGSPFVCKKMEMLKHQMLKFFKHQFSWGQKWLKMHFPIKFHGLCYIYKPFIATINGKKIYFSMKYIQTLTLTGLG